MPVLLKKVVELLEEVELRQLDPKPTHSKRWHAVKDLINEWFDENRTDIGQNPQTVLAIMSALLPDLRPDRVYMLPEGLLSKALAKALFIAGTRREDDLLNWKEATVWEDLGSAVFKVMKAAEPSAGGTVTVDELDDVLNRLAAWSHFSDDELRARVKQGQPLDKRSRLLQDLFLRLNSWEGKWVTRIILKSLLPVTIPENVTLQAYHFLLPKLYLLQDNLERACTRICSDEFVNACPDPRPSLERYYRSLREHVHLLKPEVGIKVGRAEFLKATSCQHAVRLSKGRNMLLERKYDGEYAQIHIDLSNDGKDWIKIFSKSGKNSTEDRSRMHDSLAQAIGLDNQEMRGFRQKCILEGEVVVYDDDEQKILPFHHLRSHISRKGVFIGSKNDESPKARNSHLMILLFDVLLVDDTSLLNVPLRARLQQLDKILVSPRIGRCEKAEQTVIDFSAGQQAVDRLMKCFARAIEWRWEGCILKPLDAPYFNLLEDRRDKTSLGYQRVGTDSAWIKLKKDYIEGLGDTEDFAIVGGVTNNRRRLALKQPAGMMNTFHVAVLMNKRQVKSLGEKPKLKVLCEVSYSIEKLDLEWIQKQRYFDAVEYDPEFGLSRPDYDLEYPSELSISRPTHLFNHPLVCEVKGGGFEKQTNCAFFTPRHPRIGKIHWDREFTDVVSFDELQRLAKDAILGARGGSQEERLWIAKLQRGDKGKQLEETPQEGSARTENTPSVTGSLRPNTPKRVRHPFSISPEPTKGKEPDVRRSDARGQDWSPLRKKQRVGDNCGEFGNAGVTNGDGGLFAKSFNEYMKARRVEEASQNQPALAPQTGPSEERPFHVDDAVPTDGYHESEMVKSPPVALRQLINVVPSRSSRENPTETASHAPSVTCNPTTPSRTRSAPSLPSTPFFTPSEYPRQRQPAISAPPSPSPATRMAASAPSTKSSTVRSTNPSTAPPTSSANNLPLQTRAGDYYAYEDYNPLLGRKVYVTTRLLKYPQIFERLRAHGVELFDEFVTENPQVPPYGAIVLCDHMRPSVTKAVLRFLEDKKGERPEGERFWEVWDWRVVEYPTTEEEKPGQVVKWSLWKFFDV